MSWKRLSNRVKSSKACTASPWRVSAGFLILCLLAIGYLYSPSSIYVSLFYILFGGLGGTGIWFYRSIGNEKAHYYCLTSISFFLTVAGLRAFVGFAGIGTPRSVGSIGPFVIEQLWIGGIHLHHYFLAPFFLIWGYFGLDSQKYIQKAIIYGIGLGFMIDEMGIILTGPPYYNIYSYPAIIMTQIILVALIIGEKYDD